MIRKFLNQIQEFLDNDDKDGLFLFMSRIFGIIAQYFDMAVENKKRDGVTCLVLTFNCNSPFRDVSHEHTLPEWMFVLEYNGQMISKKYDDRMIDDTLSKYVFMKNGSRAKRPDRFKDNNDKYILVGKVVEVRVKRPRSGNKADTEHNPLYILLIDTRQEEQPRTRELTTREEEMLSIAQHEIKLRNLLTYEFHPTCRQYEQGIIECKLIA